MRVARYLALILLASRRPFREVTRARIRWRLDLREAIDLSIYLTGYFQRRVIKQILKSLPEQDAVFIDVGCNRGGIAIAVAHQLPTCRVVAIDPVEAMITKLRETVQINPEIKNVQEVCAFLSSGRNESNHRLPEKVDASWNVFSEIDNPEESCAIALPLGASQAQTLDELIKKENISRIDVIKIDVDGYELSVLIGASGVLRQFAPTLIMEWAPGSLWSRGASPRNLSEFLEDEGYVPLRIRALRSPIYVDWSDLTAVQRGESIELLLVKKDR